MPQYASILLLFMPYLLSGSELGGRILCNGDKAPDVSVNYWHKKRKPSKALSERAVRFCVFAEDAAIPGVILQAIGSLNQSRYASMTSIIVYTRDQREVAPLSAAETPVVGVGTPRSAINRRIEEENRINSGEAVGSPYFTDKFDTSELAAAFDINERIYIGAISITAASPFGICQRETAHSKHSVTHLTRTQATGIDTHFFLILPNDQIIWSDDSLSGMSQIDALLDSCINYFLSDYAKEQGFLYENGVSPFLDNDSLLKALKNAKPGKKQEPNDSHLESLTGAIAKSIDEYRSTLEAAAEQQVKDNDPVGASITYSRLIALFPADSRSRSLEKKMRAIKNQNKNAAKCIDSLERTAQTIDAIKKLCLEKPYAESSIIAKVTKDENPVLSSTNQELDLLFQKLRSIQNEAPDSAASQKIGDIINLLAKRNSASPHYSLSVFLFHANYPYTITMQSPKNVSVSAPRGVNEPNVGNEHD